MAMKIPEGRAACPSMDLLIGAGELLEGSPTLHAALFDDSHVELQRCLEAQSFAGKCTEKR